MSAEFWVAFFAFLGAAIAQIPLIIAAFKSNQKIDAAKTVALATKLELTEQVSQVQKVAERSKHEITAAFMAGERSGYVGGIQEGKKQATGPMPLE